MKRKITKLMAALALLLFVAPPMVGWGQTRTIITDELTRDLIDVTGTSYSEWSGITSNSDAVYAGQSAGGNSSIQLRSNNNNSGIITTTSGGTVSKITVEWNSNTTNGRTLNVYGKSTAYSAATDLYDSSNQGTLLGTIVCGTSTELAVDGTYEYIGMRSASGAMYLTKINIEWEVGGGDSPYITAENVEIDYDATDGQIEYTIENAVQGGSVSASTLSDWLILGDDFTSPISFTCSSNTSYFARTASITLTYTYNTNETVTKNVMVTQDGDPNGLGSESNPFNVAQAREFIDGLNGAMSSEVHVSGIISQIDSYNSTYHSITYWISDDGTTTDQLEVYSGKGLNGADFNSIDDLMLQSEVVVKGNLKLYNNSIYEFNQSSQIVSLTIPSTYITAEDVEITYDTDADEIEYTINNPVEGGILTAATQSDWLTLGEVGGTIPFTCSINESAGARTATVTLTYTYGDNQTVTKDVTVTQAGNPNIVDLISDITEVGTAYTVRGTVVATNSRGFIMGDGTSYVYTYLNAAPTVTVGDMITVSGTTGTYGQIIQFTSSATIAEATESNYDGGPEYTVITEVPDYSGSYHISDYFQFEGTLTATASGNYTNYEIALGESQIRISYPTTEQTAELDALLNKTVRVHGFFSGLASSGTVFTVTMESIEEIAAPAEPSITLAYIDPNNHPFTPDSPYTIELPSDPAGGNIDIVECNNFTHTLSASDLQIQFYNDNNETIDQPEWIGSAQVALEDNVFMLQVESYINEGEARTAYFKVYAYASVTDVVYSDLVTVTQEAYVAPVVSESWVLTDLADLTENDVFVIVGTMGNTGNSFAMSNDNGASSAPLAVLVTVSSDESHLTNETIADNIQWNISGNANDGYTFYPNGDTENWLYCTATNNGVRVGTNDNNTFSLSDEGYLNNDATQRYLGIFNGQDWRCYASINANIINQTFAFYKKVVDEPQVASITLATYSVEATAAETNILIPVTYQNIETSAGLEIHWFEATGAPLQNGYEWITADFDGNNDVYIVINANNGEARTAYFKVYGLDTDANEVYSDLVTVSQEAYVAPAETWVLTNLADLMEGDIFVIVGTRIDNNAGNYAMPNDKGTSSAPNAVAITVEDNALTKAPADNLKWNISVTADGYIFYPNGSTDTWLYCTNTNNGVRVGVGDARHFTLSNNGYLTTTETAVQRYLGLYNAQDWRCYNSESGNIANQSFAFYKKVVEPETYTLNITGYGENEGGYNLIASPVYVKPETTGMTEGSFDLYWFDQTQELEWRNYENAAFNLVPGKGYLYAHDTDVELTFAGTPYSGDGNISLVKDDNADWAGWNLVGNPFGTTAYIDRDFYAMNEDGTDIMTDASQGAVAAMRGIFVIADENGETLTFSTEAPAAAANVTLNLTQSRGTVIDRAIVRFGEGRQLPKFQLNAESTKLYIPQGNNDFAVVRSGAQGEMPVNFKASKNGSYTIAIDAKNVEVSYLHLIDNMTGADVDLLATPSYTFDANTTDYANRFRLVFSANNVNDNTTSETFAYFNGSEWSISNTGRATLQVVDVLGRIVSSESINGNTTLSTTSLKDGVYMFRLVNGENVKVQKVVVK